MSDPGAAVKALLEDIDRAAAAFETSQARTDARVRDAGRELEVLRDAERGARIRAERAEQATALLREEREVIRGALREVAGTGDPASGSGSR